LACRAVASAWWKASTGRARKSRYLPSTTKKGIGAVAGDGASVVGEHVDPRVRGVQSGSELARLTEAGEIDEEVVRADLARNGLRLAPRTADNHDLVAVLVQLAGGGGADAVARACDNDGLSRDGSLRRMCQ
jgi:hypothetical protein